MKDAAHLGIVVSRLDHLDVVAAVDPDEHRVAGREMNVLEKLDRVFSSKIADAASEPENRRRLSRRGESSMAVAPVGRGSVLEMSEPFPVVGVQPSDVNAR